MIEKFSTGFKENIEGSTTSLMESSLGARIKDILFKQFKENIAKINTFEHLKDELISTAIKNTLGIRSSLFIPEQAFEMLTKKLILKLHDPSVNCLYQVLDELKKSLQMIRIKEFEIYPNLANEVIQIIDHMLNNLARPAQDMIENLIKVESVYINIEHPDFIGGSKVMVEDLEKENEPSEPLFFINKDNQFPHYHEPTTAGGPDDPLKQTERKNVVIIKRLIESYFDIVKKNIRDAVPKCIMTFLVYKGKSGVHTELVSNLYKESKIYELLAEPEDIQEKRKKCKELLRALERANSIINEIRNIS